MVFIYSDLCRLVYVSGELRADLFLSLHTDLYVIYLHISIVLETVEKVLGTYISEIYYIHSL